MSTVQSTGNHLVIGLTSGISATLSVREFALQSGIGRDSCYQAIRDGVLHAIRIGSRRPRLRIPRSELEKFPQRLLEAQGVSE